MSTKTRGKHFQTIHHLPSEFVSYANWQLFHNILLVSHSLVGKPIFHIVVHSTMVGPTIYYVYALPPARALYQSWNLSYFGSRLRFIILKIIALSHTTCTPLHLLPTACVSNQWSPMNSATLFVVCGLPSRHNSPN
jgi:hypothetical protein